MSWGNHPDSCYPVRDWALIWNHWGVRIKLRGAVKNVGIPTNVLVRLTRLIRKLRWSDKLSNSVDIIQARYLYFIVISTELKHFATLWACILPSCIIYISSVLLVLNFKEFCHCYITIVMKSRTEGNTPSSLFPIPPFLIYPSNHFSTFLVDK